MYMYRVQAGSSGGGRSFLGCACNLSVCRHWVVVAFPTLPRLLQAKVTEENIATIVVVDSELVALSKLPKLGSRSITAD